jgi:hypothetical protein
MFRLSSGVLGLIGVITAVACGGDSAKTTDSHPTGHSKLPFAACCTAASECASGVRDDDHKACSQACATDADCPAEPKSGTPKCKDSVCASERADVDCEHAGETGGATGSGGANNSGGETGSGGAATGGNSSNDTGGAPSSSGGSAATGGSAAGGKGSGTIGTGDPCTTDTGCKSGICYRPGGTPGFCTAECSQSFDATCAGVSNNQNLAGEYMYCMPFANGGRCYPGCVTTKTCTQYAGTVCTDTKDIDAYGGKVCLERL